MCFKPKAAPCCVPGYCPLPVSETVCGLFPALSAMVNVAERAPVAWGTNWMLMVQEA